MGAPTDILHLTGTPRVTLAGRLAPPLALKVYALVCLVSLKFDGIVDRGRVAELLWEDQGAEAARANLRNLLADIKKWQQVTGLTLVGYDHVRVYRSADTLASDVDLLNQRSPAANDEELSSLVELYGGDLLDGQGDGLGSDLASWLAEQRTQLRERFLQLALPAVGRADATAEPVVRRLVAKAGYDERALSALLIHLSRHKPGSVISREYDTLARRLEEESGAPPATETRMLAHVLGAQNAAAAPGRPERLDSSPGLPRILVLHPMGEADAAVQQMATSLVDDVIFGLCRMRTFAVIAPHTARIISRHGGAAPISPPVDYILFTRLLPGGPDGEWRFGFSLARAQSGEILLGDQLKFASAHLPLRHADLARVVTSHVASGVERFERELFQTTCSSTAYLHFLMGQERMHSIDLPDLRAARKSFRQALDLAPTFAPAMSMIARTLSFEWFLLNGGDDDLLAQSRAMAKRAIDIDPLDPGGYRELGNAALYAQDLEGMLENHATARDRAPHHADVLLDNADALVHASRYGEARPIMALAMSLNPMPPDDYPWVAATIEFFERNFAGALKHALSMSNPEPLGRFIAASAHQVGDRQMARHWRDRMMERHPDFRVADWGKIVPIRNAHDRAFAMDVMRSAGFP